MRLPGVIDCQSHVYGPAVLEKLEHRREHPLVYHEDGHRYVQMGDWHRRVFPQHTSVEATLAAMDANDIERAALRDARLTAAHEEQILHLNARRLFGL